MFIKCLISTNAFSTNESVAHNTLYRLQTFRSATLDCEDCASFDFQDVFTNLILTILKLCHTVTIASIERLCGIAITQLTHMQIPNINSKYIMRVTYTIFNIVYDVSFRSIHNQIENNMLMDGINWLILIKYAGTATVTT